MKLPEGVLAYLLLNCANISEEKMEICRATCPDLTFNNMRQTIEKVGVGSSEDKNDKQITFSSDGQGSSGSSFSAPDVSNTIQIKQEPVYLAADHNTAPDLLLDYSINQSDEYCDEDEVYYGNNQRPGRFVRYPSRQSALGGNNQKVYVKRDNYSQIPKMNARDSAGNVLTCKFCHSYYHYVAACPDCPEYLKRSYISKGQKSFGSSQSHYI